MYQSTPSMTILPGKTAGHFSDGRIPLPQGKKNVQNPDPPAHRND